MHTHIRGPYVEKVKVVSSPQNVIEGGQFCDRHFSARRHFDGGTYLLSIIVLPSSPPKEGSYSFTAPILKYRTESAKTMQAGRQAGLRVLRVYM